MDNKKKQTLSLCSLEQCKKNNTENKNLLGLDESLEIIKNKSDLRERIADIDQKLVHYFHGQCNNA